MKHAMTVVGVYLVAGIGVTAWSAYRGGKGQAHWTGLGQGPALGLSSSVALWPYAVFYNLTAKPGQN
jgi:hypothetical protein